MTDSTDREIEAIKKTSRAKSSRAATAKRTPWSPKSNLDAPPAPDGYKHRWIRAETRGYDDTSNISARLREGYELVRRDEYPDFEAPTIDSGRYEGVFGNAYFTQKHADQVEAVETDVLRENAHSTMRIGKPERQSRVTFGGPRNN